MAVRLSVKAPILRFIRRIAAGQPITIFGADKVLDFTFVDDCVDGIARGVTALAAGRVRNETINLACGQGNTLVRMAELVGQALDKTPQINVAPTQLGEVTRYVADISKAKALLGYAPQVPLEAGIPRAVAWSREWETRR